jgi:hypothetical protein
MIDISQNVKSPARLLGTRQRCVSSEIVMSFVFIICCVTLPSPDSERRYFRKFEIFSANALGHDTYDGPCAMIALDAAFVVRLTEKQA